MTQNFNKISLLHLNNLIIKGRLSAKQIKLQKVDCLNNHLLGFFINVLSAKNNNMMENLIDAWIAIMWFVMFVLAAQMIHLVLSKIFATTAVIKQSSSLNQSKIRSSKQILKWLIFNNSRPKIKTVLPNVRIANRILTM
jgi:hypothetical protein